MSKQL